MPATSLNYLDTSFLLKGYVNEEGSSLVTAYVRDPQQILLVSALTDLEMSAALANKLGAEQARQVFSIYRADRVVGVYGELTMTAGVWAHAEAVASQYANLLHLRALDTLHLATALHYGAENIATYDQRLAAAAAALGLSVVGARP